MNTVHCWLQAPLGWRCADVLTLSCWVPLPVSFQQRFQAAAGYLGVFGRAVKDRHTAQRVAFFLSWWIFTQINLKNGDPKALNSFFFLIGYNHWQEISTNPKWYCDLNWLDMCERLSSLVFTAISCVISNACFVFVCDLYLYIKHLIKTT